MVLDTSSYMCVLIATGTTIVKMISQSVTIGVLVSSHFLIDHRLITWREADAQN